MVIAAGIGGDARDRDRRGSEKPSSCGCARAGISDFRLGHLNVWGYSCRWRIEEDPRVERVEPGTDIVAKFERLRCL